MLIIGFLFVYRVSKFLNDKDPQLISLKLDRLGKPRTMNNLKPIFTTIIISISFSLMGCSGNTKTNETPALFETKAEAEEAAKDFNCTGAHRMGDKWMPCQSHSAHEDKENIKSSNGHHHHH